MGRWTAIAGNPDIPKAVFIVVPHISNWYGIWALIYRVTYRIDVKFFAKDSLFWFPLRVLLH